MFRTTIDLQLAIDRAAKTVMRDHSLDGALNKEFGTALTALTEGLGFVSADETGEAHVGLLGLLLTADLDVRRIDDDDEITGVNMGGENGLVLATKQIGCLHGDMAEVLVFGIDHPPVAFYLGGFSGKSTH